MEVSSLSFTCQILENKIFGGNQLPVETESSGSNSNLDEIQKILEFGRKNKFNFTKSSVKCDEIGKKLKENGNKYFKQNNIDQAILYYSRGIRIAKVTFYYIYNVDVYVL